MMSPLCARMNKKKEVVLNSVAEFLGIWALRGEASLSLKTKDGVTTIAFTISLSLSLTSRLIGAENVTRRAAFNSTLDRTLHYS